MKEIFTQSVNGYFGSGEESFGGCFVPETLYPALLDLQDAYHNIFKTKDFKKELKKLLKNFVGRPTPLIYAKNASSALGNEIYLKFEGLANTGAHKINNALAQTLLAKQMEKKYIIAETGAGQHGVAVASVCAFLGMPCKVFMGSVDVARQRPNVFIMQQFGAEVISVNSGSKTLKDAVNEALRHWSKDPINSFYVLGSALGPSPYPDIVRDSQMIIGKEIKKQILKEIGTLPDYILACVGGGSNAMGAFTAFLHDEVELVGIEAGGIDNMPHHNAMRLSHGHKASVGITHGYKSYFLQTEDGQIAHTHSISAGLDYAGISPQLAHLHSVGRVKFYSASDTEALDAMSFFAKNEGILAALESSHALAGAIKLSKDIKGKCFVVNVSGRGDKDIFITAKELCTNEWLDFLKQELYEVSKKIKVQKKRENKSETEISTAPMPSLSDEILELEDSDLSFLDSKDEDLGVDSDSVVPEVLDTHNDDSISHVEHSETSLDENLDSKNLCHSEPLAKNLDSINNIENKDSSAAPQNDGASRENDINHNDGVLDTQNDEISQNDNITNNDENISHVEHSEKQTTLESKNDVMLSENTHHVEHSETSLSNNQDLDSKQLQDSNTESTKDLLDLNESIKDLESMQDINTPLLSIDLSLNSDSGMLSLENTLGCGELDSDELLVENESGKELLEFLLDGANLEIESKDSSSLAMLEEVASSTDSQEDALQNQDSKETQKDSSTSLVNDDTNVMLNENMNHVENESETSLNENLNSINDFESKDSSPLAQNDGVLDSENDDISQSNEVLEVRNDENIHNDEVSQNNNMTNNNENTRNVEHSETSLSNNKELDSKNIEHNNIKTINTESTKKDSNTPPPNLAGEGEMDSQEVMLDENISHVEHSERQTTLESKNDVMLSDSETSLNENLDSKNLCHSEPLAKNLDSINYIENKDSSPSDKNTKNEESDELFSDEDLNLISDNVSEIDADLSFMLEENGAQKTEKNVSEAKETKDKQTSQSIENENNVDDIAQSDKIEPNCRLQTNNPTKTFKLPSQLSKIIGKSLKS